MKRTIGAAAIALSIAAAAVPQWDAAQAQPSTPGVTVRFAPPPGGIIPQPGRGSIYRERPGEDRVLIAHPERHAPSSTVQVPPPRSPARDAIENRDRGLAQ